jgi:hypothetical protein
MERKTSFILQKIQTASSKKGKLSTCTENTTKIPYLMRQTRLQNRRH